MSDKRVESENLAQSENVLEDPFFNIVLVEPRIPQNTGNIGRLCVGTRCRLHLVKPLAFDLSEKKVRRAGLDYWKHLDMTVHENWEDLVKKERIFLFSKTAKRNCFDVKFQKGDWLFFGSEDTGLPKSMMETYEEQKIGLPMYGPIRSLNLSNAVASVVYLGCQQFHQAGELG